MQTHKLFGFFALFMATMINAQTPTNSDTSNEASAKTTLIFQSANQKDSNLFELEKTWADDVQKVTDNEVKIQLKSADSIVSSSELLMAVEMGVIDGSIVPLVYNANVDPAFSLMGDMIGAWPSAKDLIDFVNTESGLNLLNELHDQKVTVIGGTVSGLESIPSKVKIQQMSDFKGVKIRTAPGLVTDIFKEIGAIPVKLSFTEVKASLEKDIIQATDYSLFSTNHKLGLHNSAKYPIYPGFHSMPLNEITINKDKWAKISADSQQAIIKSVNVFAKNMIQQLDQEDQKALAEARNDKNIEIISWSTIEIDKFRNIAKVHWQKYAEKSPKSRLVYDTVVKHLGL